MDERKVVPNRGRFYQVMVEGRIDPSWSDWLGGLQVVTSKDAGGKLVTRLSGYLCDQPALRSLLNCLWDLNLVVRSVKEIDPPGGYSEK